MALAKAKSKEKSAIPAQHKSSWLSFLKSLVSFKGDLSSLTAPPFILSTTSLTEFSMYWAEHPTIFVAPASEPDPTKRAMLVLKWFLTTLKQQHSSREDKSGRKKKPLNPFLGELFLGRWEDDAGMTYIVSEQVSHHPPVTAYRIWNEQHGISLQGYFAQKAWFSGTVRLKKIGQAHLHIDKYDEDYVFTLPAGHLEGLLTGNPFAELESNSYMQSSSGFTAKVDYSGKGWLGGNKVNSFTATLYPEGQECKPLYAACGQWNEAFIIKDSSTKEEVDSFNHDATPITPLLTAALEDQDPLESRKAWREVALAIDRGDMAAISREKSKIETRERERRKLEQREGKEWKQRYFMKVKEDKLVEELLAKIDKKVEPEKTAGIWKWKG